MGEVLKEALRLAMNYDGSYSGAVDAGFLYLLQHKDGKGKEKPAKCVYVIETDNGLVKIGVSQSPKARIKTIEKTGGHIIVNQYISEPCKIAQMIELSAHKSFQAKRKIGEYFTCTFDEAVAQVERLIKQLSAEVAPELTAEGELIVPSCGSCPTSGGDTTCCGSSQGKFGEEETTDGLSR